MRFDFAVEPLWQLWSFPAFSWKRRGESWVEDQLGGLVSKRLMNPGEMFPSFGKPEEA